MISGVLEVAKRSLNISGAPELVCNVKMLLFSRHIFWWSGNTPVKYVCRLHEINYARFNLSQC